MSYSFCMTCTWGAFIAFIVLNATEVEDVRFFASLGINLNDINTFISQVVTLIFSILLFLCTAALSFGLFKFFITKKAYKKQKITYALISTILLIVSFALKRLDGNRPKNTRPSKLARTSLWWSKNIW